MAINFPFLIRTGGDSFIVSNYAEIIVITIHYKNVFLIARMAMIFPHFNSKKFSCDRIKYVLCFLPRYYQSAGALASNR